MWEGGTLFCLLLLFSSARAVPGSLKALNKHLLNEENLGRKRSNRVTNKK